MGGARHDRHRQPAHRPRLLHPGRRDVRRRRHAGRRAPTAAASRSSSSSARTARSRPSSSRPTRRPRARRPATTGLQHDIEVTPKPASAPLNTANSAAKLGDAQLRPRRHRRRRAAATTRASPGCGRAPQGGLEIIDVTEGVDNAKEIGLTSAHRRVAHRQRRSQAPAHRLLGDVGLGRRRRRGRARQRDRRGSLSLDGFEVVDLSSCMNFPAGTTIEQKRAACRPEVYRYRYPSAAVRPGPRGRRRDRPVPRHLRLPRARGLRRRPPDLRERRRIDRLRHEERVRRQRDARRLHRRQAARARRCPAPCATPRRRSPTAQDRGEGHRLHQQTATAPSTSTSPGWKERRPVPRGRRARRHRAAHRAAPRTGQRAEARLDPGHRLQPRGRAVALRPLPDRHRRARRRHPASRRVVRRRPTASRRATAACTSTTSSRLRTTFTGEPEEAEKSYARTAKGDKAIYRAPIRTGAQVTICTSHVFQQIPGQNRIFMALVLAGHAGRRLRRAARRHAGPQGGRATSSRRPPTSGSRRSSRSRRTPTARSPTTARPATSSSTEGGRSAIDLYKVTLPAPPSPRIAGASAPAAQGPATSPTGPRRARARAPRARVCARSAARRARAAAAPVVRAAPGGKAVDVDVFRVARADRVLALRRVARFTRPHEGLHAGRPRRVRNGVYIVRFRVRGNNGGALAQRVAVRARRALQAARARSSAARPATRSSASRSTRPVVRRAQGLPRCARRAADRGRDGRHRSCCAAARSSARPSKIGRRPDRTGAHPDRRQGPRPWPLRRAGHPAVRRRVRDGHARSPAALSRRPGCARVLARATT